MLEMGIYLKITVNECYLKSLRKGIHSSLIYKNKIYLDANLFFSLRVFGLILNGNSLTGVISFILLFNLSSSLPMDCNFLEFGVKSLPSPFLALPLKDFNKK